MTIYFIKSTNTMSQRLRGDQISRMLNKYGTDSKYTNLETLFENNVVNSIIIIIKQPPKSENELNDIVRLKENNNFVVYDFLDAIHNVDLEQYLAEIPIFNKFIKLVDHFIVNSEFMKKKFTDILKKDISVIYHHWDSGFNTLLRKLKTVKDIEFVYVGNIKKYHLDKVDFISFLDTPYRLKKKNICHVCFINNLSNEMINYTSTKLATASFYESPIICNRIPVIEEILGKDYELFCDDEKSFYEKIDYVKSIYNTPKWIELINKMKIVKNILSIDGVYIKYNLFIKHLNK
jgi:hypothetical protein